MNAVMKVALYARVSTMNGHQDPETQLAALREYCKQRGWDVVGEYVDRGISGTKESRPSLNRLMLDAKRRKFEAVLVWKLDRFGRSLRHLVNALAEFEALGIAFVSMTDSLDMTTPQGRLMFGIISAMTEFERALIVERVKAGMRRVKAEGSKSGRPIGRPSPFLDIAAIKQRIAAGEQRQHIAASLGVSPALITKRLK
jgi:DNA invertase Pin-like site-specific DNA recombinase